MSCLLPCKRRVFITRLKKIGFTGPYFGSKHEFMVFQNYLLSIPSNNEYSVPQVRMMIDEVESIIGRKIGLDEWNNL
jgi:hypothetical protein